MRSWLSIRGVLAVTACVICLGAAVWAQNFESPNPLGDVARQTRAQHASAPVDRSGNAQGLVDEMQQEQEAAENAPTGFKSYDAGAYRLFVPFPYTLEGRDNGGAVLLGSRLGITNTEVLAGAPISIPTNTSDSQLSNLVRQLASQHGSQAYCSAIKQGSHKAFRCAWQGNPFLLGHVVWGSMEFIVASDSLLPVMCVSPDDMHSCRVYDTRGNNTCSDRDRSLYGWDHQKAQSAADIRYRDERTTFQMCDQVIYPSIQLKEEIVVHPATLSGRRRPKTAAGTIPQDTSVAAGGIQGPTLVDLARETRQTPHGKAQATLDNAEGNSAPSGFQFFSLQYCPNPQQCTEASVVIPEKVEVVSRVNGQHIFKAALNGEPVMLYAGPADVNAPYRSSTDPDFIRMRDLANTNGWSREKPDSVSTQDLTIEGKPALMTRFRYQREPKKWWVGERVLIETQRFQNQGAQNPVGQFLVGCTAPEERFADAEVLCTTLVNSLRLP